MTEPASVELLQVCPSDHPPFLDICQVYQSAATELERHCVTVFLGPARGEPMAGAVYLDQSSLDSSRRLGRVLAEWARGYPGKLTVSLALCHRHRALRAFLSSGLGAQHTLCVAHEFGYFRRVRRRLQRAVFQRHVQFAGVSPPVVAELDSTLAGTHLLPNGIDLSGHAARSLPAAVAQQALGLRDDDFNVAVVGRLHPKKQPQLALAGFTPFAAEHADATLTFLGDGELLSELSRASQGPRTRFAGFIPHAARYLSAFDVVLIPSGAAEAFNLVALEAMAAGVRVVAGPAPGPRYVLGDAGLYFSEQSPAAVAAALEAAYADRGANHEAGSDRAQSEFSVTAVAQRLRPWLS